MSRARKSTALHRASGIVLAVLILGCGLLLAYGISVGKNMYAIPLGVMASVLLLAFRLRHPARAKLTLLISTVILCCYLAEVVLAALLPLRPALAAWEDNRAYDFRSYRDVVEDLREQGTDAFPALMPRPFFTNWRQDWPVYPLGGISKVTTVYCNELGRYLVYKADKHGFHNPPGLWQLGGIQIGIVGDSFAHGACVPSKESFASLIRDVYPRTLNLAMGANGPLTIFAGIKEYLAVLKPAAVLWFFYEGNDLFDLRNESSNTLLMRYLREDFRQNLLARQPEIDRVLKDFAETSLLLNEDPNPFSPTLAFSDFAALVLRMAHLRGLIIETFNDPWGQTVPLQVSQLDLFEEVLKTAKNLVSSWDGSLYFVFLPGWNLTVSKESRQQVIYEHVLDRAFSAGLPVIDLVPAFRSHPHVEHLFVYPGSHYNPKGHRIVAETVLARLAEDMR